MDKPAFWEYLLTAEVLRGVLDPVKSRWRALKGGLYALPLRTIEFDQYTNWHSSHIEMITNQTSALNAILNGEIQLAWGAPGEPGSERDIVRTCKLIKEACERMLMWEESVRFAYVSEEYQPVKDVLVGICEDLFEKIFSISDWLGGIFSSDSPKGTHSLLLVFKMPDGWADRHAQACKQAAKAVRSRSH